MFAGQGRAPRAAAVGLVLLATGAAAFAPVPVCALAPLKPALCFLLFTGQPRGERKPWRLFGKLSSCVYAAPCPRPCAARIANPQVSCTLQLAWPDAVRQSACACVFVCGAKRSGRKELPACHGCLHACACIPARPGISSSCLFLSSSCPSCSFVGLVAVTPSPPSAHRLPPLLHPPIALPRIALLSVRTA
jgi:hypothetical protein